MSPQSYKGKPSLLEKGTRAFPFCLALESQISFVTCFVETESLSRASSRPYSLLQRKEGKEDFCFSSSICIAFLPVFPV